MSSRADHYFNRDSLFWRVADQYGLLYRNIMWNTYLMDKIPQPQFIKNVMGRVPSGGGRDLNQMNLQLQDRHYFAKGGDAFRDYAVWVKRFFLPVDKIKVFVHQLFNLLDWCLEQESNYGMVIVDVEIGRKIIAGAAKMCFRFSDSCDNERQINEAYSAGVARTHIQDVIRRMWREDLYPNWKTPTEGYMQSHGQFLQSIFNHGDNSCISQLYKTFCAAQRAIFEASSYEHNASAFQSNIGGEFADLFRNTMQIVEPFFEPEFVTTFYDVREGDTALRGFTEMFVLPDQTTSRQVRTHFMYTLYLSGYGDHFDIKLARLTNDFPASDYGRVVSFPTKWKIFRGAYFNKVPIQTWAELLKITKYAQSVYSGDEKAQEEGGTLGMLQIKQEPVEGGTAENPIVLEPTRIQRRHSVPSGPPRKAFHTASQPRAGLVPLRISKKRAREPLVEGAPALEQGSLEPAASRRRHNLGSRSYSTPTTTVEYVEPSPGGGDTGGVAVTDKNTAYVVFAGIGALTIGAVLYARGRA